MPTDPIFLDANILLEIILTRSQATSARRLLEGLHTKAYISALTAHLVVHFGQAIVDLTVLRLFLQDYIVLPLDSGDFEWAFTNMRGKDFEDALQVAVAVRNGCDSIITLDKGFAKNYRDFPILGVRYLGEYSFTF